LDDLPNSHQQIPSAVHPNHDLYNEKLLNPAEVTTAGLNSFVVQTCQQCYSNLDKQHPDLPLPLSLANNLWIGLIPSELSSLTFPEQLIIAQVYSPIFVFKLFPKKGYLSDSVKLQRAMQGTVMTYELDQAGVAAMLKGNLMLR